ncbi:MAG: hypothetical protein Kow00104_05280 [Rhodothalassiaceae bacterium]
MIRVSLAQCLTVLLALSAPAAAGEPYRAGAFLHKKSVLLDATPAEVWDAVTGDIGGWWDHKFSAGAPARFFIEARPGGGFWEYFDPEGLTGVRHAVVIFSNGRDRLVFDGPLGFNGHAVSIVTGYEITDLHDGKSRLDLSLSYAGAEQDGWRDAMIGVWDHFLSRLEGYLAAGCRGGGPCDAFP